MLMLPMPLPASHFGFCVSISSLEAVLGSSLTEPEGVVNVPHPSLVMGHAMGIGCGITALASSSSSSLRAAAAVAASSPC